MSINTQAYLSRKQDHLMTNCTLCDPNVMGQDDQYALIIGVHLLVKRQTVVSCDSCCCVGGLNKSLRTTPTSIIMVKWSGFQL